METNITKIEDLLLEYSNTPAKLAEELKKVKPIDEELDLLFGDEKINSLYSEYLRSGNVTNLCAYVNKNFSEEVAINKADIPLEIISTWLEQMSPDLISGWAESRHSFMGDNLDLVGDTIEKDPKNPSKYFLEVDDMLHYVTPMDMAVIIKALPTKEELVGCPYEEVWSYLKETPPKTHFTKEEVNSFVDRLKTSINKMSGPPLNRFLNVVPPHRRLRALYALANNEDPSLFPLASAEAGNFSIGELINEDKSRTGKAWSRNMRTYKNSFKLLDLSEPIYEKLRKEIYDSDSKDERLAIVEDNSDILEPSLKQELLDYIESLEGFDKSEVLPKEVLTKAFTKPGDMGLDIDWLNKVKKYLPFEEADSYEELINKLQETSGISQLRSFSLTKEEVEQIKSAKKTSTPVGPKRKFKEIPTGINPSTPSDSRGFAEEDVVPKGAIGSTTGEAPTGFKYLENDFKKQIIDRNYINYDRPKRVQDRRVSQYLQTPPEKRKEFRYDIYKKEGPDGYKRFLEVLAKEGAM